MKAWKEWIDRDSQERLEKARKLEKREKLTKSWELVKECRKILRENYSSWQERLEKAKGKQEKFKISREMQSKEEAMRKRIILSEIKENAWKRREEKSSHEEHSERLEKEEKNEKRELMKVRMKQLEEGRKSAEEKEREGRNKFLEDWKIKVARKKKQEILQKGRKDLLRKCGRVGGAAGRRF